MSNDPTILPMCYYDIDGRRCELTPELPNYDNLKKELASFINLHSIENGSDTPDYILADFLMSCLKAFDSAVRERDRWYGSSRGKKKGKVVR